MSALGLVLVGMLALTPGREVRVAEVERLAGTLTTAAHVHGLDPALLAALAWLESGLRYSARSHVGASGVLQLHPRSRWGLAWAADCAVSPPDFCRVRNVHWAAKALSSLVAACGGVGAGLGAYRTGRCQEGPRARLVIRLAARIRAGVRGELAVPDSVAPVLVDRNSTNTGRGVGTCRRDQDGRPS